MHDLIFKGDKIVFRYFLFLQSFPFSHSFDALYKHFRVLHDKLFDQLIDGLFFFIAYRILAQCRIGYYHGAYECRNSDLYKYSMQDQIVLVSGS